MKLCQCLLPAARSQYVTSRFKELTSQLHMCIKEIQEEACMIISTRLTGSFQSCRNHAVHRVARKLDLSYADLSTGLVFGRLRSVEWKNWNPSVHEVRASCCFCINDDDGKTFEMRARSGGWQLVLFNRNSIFRDDKQQIKRKRFVSFYFVCFNT